MENNTDENNIEEYVKDQERSQAPPSLGRVNTNVEMPLMADVGYLKIPMKDLPSQGLFYPDETQIVIRAASVGEIRHWSSIDETDYSNMDDILNFIIEKCVRVKIPNLPATWKDIKDIDRFYLIFAIREFTFKNGENKLYVPGDDNQRIEVTKDMISYFNLDDKINKFYDQESRNFVVRKNKRINEDIEFFIPSIGLAQFIKNYVQEKRRNNKPFDESFIKFASFIFSDWRGLTHDKYEKVVSNSVDWSIEKISLYDKFTELLAGGINPKIVYESGGMEQEAPLNFSGGIKSLFIISDILDELV